MTKADDLVARLRNPAVWGFGNGSLMAEAADRIEALEADNAKAWEVGQAKCNRLGAERDAALADAASAEAAKDEWVLRFRAVDAELARIHAVMAEVDAEVDPLDEELADMHAEAADLRAERDAEKALADMLATPFERDDLNFPQALELFDDALAAWRARRGQGGGE